MPRRQRFAKARSARPSWAMGGKLDLFIASRELDDAIRHDEELPAPHLAYFEELLAADQLPENLIEMLDYHWQRYWSHFGDADDG
jgi:hypothetical protein